MYKYIKNIAGKLHLNFKCSYPLSAAGEERVVERSDDRVSQAGGHYRKCISANVRRVDSPSRPSVGTARPSLPLRGKEGKAHIFNFSFKSFLNAIIPQNIVLSTAFAFIAFISLSLPGCTKLNQVSPTSVPASDMFKDTTSLQEALTGLYSTLESENYYGYLLSHVC